MTLTGNYGGNLVQIHCEAIDTNVMELDESGDQVLSRKGLAVEVKPGFLPFAPDNCPLTIEASKRDLGSLAVCKGCSNATLMDEGGGMEI